MMTYEEWTNEAMRRFGPNSLAWKFVCPSCGHVASVKDWKDAGASDGAIAFSCVGRFLAGKKDADKNTFGKGGGPCTYAGGGLFKLNPVEVNFNGKVLSVFAFADPVTNQTDKGPTNG